jgi:hypothetical protein
MVKAQKKVHCSKIYAAKGKNVVKYLSCCSEVQSMPDPKVPTPAYVPFKTFISVLDSFRSFLPDAIDPTMWPSYSGGIKSQLIGSLKFLKLIDAQNRPTPALRSLAEADAQHRPALLKAVLTDAYGDLCKLDLTKATPGSFDAEMRKFGQEGDTHRKACSFFLQVAKLAGIPLSPLLLKKGSLSGTRRKRPGGSNGAGKGKLRVDSVTPPPIDPPRDPKLPFMAAVRQITLTGGGRLILSTNADPFRMPATDRNFVNELLGKFDTFQEQNAAVEDEEETEEDAEEES